MEKYQIKLAGIDEEGYAESFEITNVFLDKFLDFKITKSSLVLNVKLKKEGITTYHLNCEIEGKIRGIPCDICAENLIIPINSQISLIVKEVGEALEATEEIIYIKPKQNKIDITYLIFEMVTLAIPVKRIHKLDKHGNSTCNKEMLNLIKKYFTKKPILNDPRWDPLKKITY